MSPEDIVEGSRNRAPRSERFSESKYSMWSAYDMDRRGERHDRVWDDIEEAAKAEPFLKAELDALFTRVHGGATAPSGYLVVKAQWLKLEKSDCEGGLRSYSLLDAEVLLVVNHMVRLSGLRCSDGKGGPQQRELRSLTEAKAAVR